VAKNEDFGHGIEKGGYQPLNEGYSPGDRRGYTPHAHGTGLPKAPVGGTGQTTPANAKGESGS
jgi:hypothetical protein